MKNELKLDVDHAVYDVNCPCYLKYQKIKMSKIDYV